MAQVFNKKVLRKKNEDDDNPINNPISHGPSIQWKSIAKKKVKVPTSLG